MSNPDRIEVEDTVEVEWAQGDCSVRGVVLSIPGSVGDAWIIKGTKGKIVYIQTYECISLLEKKP